VGCQPCDCLRLASSYPPEASRSTSKPSIRSPLCLARSGYRLFSKLPLRCPCGIYSDVTLPYLTSRQEHAATTFFLRHLKDAAQKMQRGSSRLYTAFIDFKQACDLIPRDKLWDDFNYCRMLQHLVPILQGLIPH
jgi:hypothetical protein